MHTSSCPQLPTILHPSRNAGIKEIKARNMTSKLRVSARGMNTAVRKLIFPLSLSWSLDTLYVSLQPLCSPFNTPPTSPYLLVCYYYFHTYITQHFLHSPLSFTRSFVISLSNSHSHTRQSVSRLKCERKRIRDANEFAVSKVFQGKYHPSKDAYLANILNHLKLCLTIKVCYGFFCLLYSIAL